MSTASSVAAFVDMVARLQLVNCFNPYTDRYDPFDFEDAAEIRRANLTHVLHAAASAGIDDLWVGLELGHKGGRRTGLAMTDETSLAAHGARFGVAADLRRATHRGPVKEMTASIVWEALGKIRRPVFLWNVVPIHPHRAGDQLSNRRHTPCERDTCKAQLKVLINLVRPKRLVAIGNHASVALGRCGFDHELVRHPAFGGKKEFLERIGNLA